MEALCGCAHQFGSRGTHVSGRTALEHWSRLFSAVLLAGCFGNSELPTEKGMTMSKIRLPRLIVNALCTTCGDFLPEVGSLTMVRKALAHSAETAHVVVLNGTVDVPEADEPQPVGSVPEADHGLPSPGNAHELVPIELLEEYWKAGCQCRADSVELCALCKTTETVLLYANRL